ncbi:DNA-binding domain-containing protein, partial [Burkholderia sp. SIMBA_052]
PDGVDADTIAATLLPGPKLSASACLAIYQRSYILRLRKCLEEQFPASYHALGAALFADFADEYLRACPSDSYTLHELGRRFPE